MSYLNPLQKKKNKKHFKNWFATTNAGISTSIYQYQSVRSLNIIKKILLKIKFQLKFNTDKLCRKYTTVCLRSKKQVLDCMQSNTNQVIQINIKL